jgi:hypothetical protein
MIALARAEEKIMSIQENQQNQMERVNRLSVKIDDIDKKVDDNARVVNVISKLFWVVLVAAVGAITTNIWM